MSSALSRDEKERFLRAVEEDREFRYALMGLLGFKEILDRITRIEERVTRIEERQQRIEERIVELQERFAKLEERQQKLEERQLELEKRQQELEERFAKLEERFAKLEERFAELEERQQKLEERFAKLEERFARLEEHFAKLEERQQKLEERFAELDRRQQKLEERMIDLMTEIRELRRVVTVIAHRFGVLSESAFREAMKHVVEEVLGVAVVEKWSYRDEEGFVYGYPSIIDVDVVIKDNVHILIEIKSRVSRGDVAELYRIGKLYEKVRGVKPQLVIIGGFIDPEAYKAGARLGVEIKPAFRED